MVIAMSGKTFSLFDPAIHVPVYNVEVSGDSRTGGLTDGEESYSRGQVESIVVWREPKAERVVLTFDYEDGATHDLTHRWFRLSFDEGRRLAAALLNATEAEN
jgi:hypothetical protein